MINININIVFNINIISISLLLSGAISVSYIIDQYQYQCHYQYHYQYIYIYVHTQDNITPLSVTALTLCFISFITAIIPFHATQLSRWTMCCRCARYCWVFAMQRWAWRCSVRVRTRWPHCPMLHAVGLASRRWQSIFATHDGWSCLLLSLPMLVGLHWWSFPFLTMRVQSNWVYLKMEHPNFRGGISQCLAHSYRNMFGYCTSMSPSYSLDFTIRIPFYGQHHLCWTFYDIRVVNPLPPDFKVFLM